MLPDERKGDFEHEHAQEVIELLSGFRAIMGRNFDTLDVEKIQERWWVTIHGQGAPDYLTFPEVLRR